MSELLVPTIEAARRLGCKKTKLFELLRLGELPAVRLGRKTLISVADLEKFAASLPARTCERSIQREG